MDASICYKLRGGGTLVSDFYDSPQYFWTQAFNIFYTVFEIIDPAANKSTYLWLWDASRKKIHLQLCLMLNYQFSVALLVVVGSIP